MSETGVAKLFKHGRSQAVRLPSPFVSLAIGCACAAWAVAFCWSRSSPISTVGSPRWIALPRYLYGKRASSATDA